MRTRAWPTELVELADGVFAYIQATGGFCISNAGFIVGDDEVLVVDTLFTPSMNRAFRSQIRRVTRKPVRHLINTHHHIDHTFGNAFFPESRIISHRDARREVEGTDLAAVLGFITGAVPGWTDEVKDGRLRAPEIGFVDEMELNVSGRTVRLLDMGHGHAPGDVAVLLPDDRILFAGDLAFFWVTPASFDARISPWIRSCGRLLQLDVAKIVPGHGSVGNLDDLRLMRRYLALLRRQARRSHSEGRSPREAAQALKLGGYASWNEPERALLTVYRLYEEFNRQA